MHQLRKRSLLISVQDENGAISILEKEGFKITVTREGFLELTGKNAILHPEKVNSLLVNAGYPPTS